ncbi:hypothetical protein VTU32_06500 [Thermoanaerobacter sp. CM-CNRG TB177]|nr:hypothetical protein [Thermoanaerobacter sp. CM-CNRG TB177]
MDDMEAAFFYKLLEKIKRLEPSGKKEKLLIKALVISEMAGLGYSREKTYMGFATGDIVKAVVPRGKYAGVHVGRIAIRQRPSFRLNGFDVHPKYLTILQRSDGYEYGYRAAHSSSQ